MKDGASCRDDHTRTGDLCGGKGHPDDGDSSSIGILDTDDTYDTDDEVPGADFVPVAGSDVFCGVTVEAGLLEPTGATAEARWATSTATVTSTCTPPIRATTELVLNQGDGTFREVERRPPAGIPRRRPRLRRGW